jgi:hypothetical protein
MVRRGIFKMARATIHIAPPSKPMETAMLLDALGDEIEILGDFKNGCDESDRESLQRACSLLARLHELHPAVGVVAAHSPGRPTR